MNSPQVSIIVPFFNEQDCLPIFFQEFDAQIKSWNFSFEIVFVDDGSSDSSFALIKKWADSSDFPVQIVILSRNFGKEKALIAGMRASTGQATIPLDADLQDPIEYIPVLVEQWVQGFELVLAKRSKREGDTWLKKHSARFFYRLMTKFSGFPIPEDVGDFRLMSRKVTDYFLALNEHTRYNKGLFAYVGFDAKTIEYERPERSTGEVKQGYWKLFRLAMNAFFSVSGGPLRVVTIGSVITSCAASVWIIYILYAAFNHQVSVPGYASLITILLSVSSVQLISIAVIGEYVNRINEEVRQRPLYVVQNHYNNH